MSANEKTVKPEILGGFRDVLPGEALIQQAVVEKIKRVYECFGFLPLDTPCMERLDVLTGGSPDFNKSIFLARIARGLEDKGTDTADWDEDYALRFDLTVSLARVVAGYPQLGRPFKRYQIGKVWRGERPQAGRFREFYQLDFDTIGSASITADIEVVQIMYEVMKALGLSRFLIKFNTRKVLNGLAESVGCVAKAKEVFRIIDKLDKIGVEGVLKELMRQPDNALDENALALPIEQAQKVIRFLQLREREPLKLLSQLRDFFGSTSVSGLEGVKDLENMTNALTALNIPAENWCVDLSVARGLDYYTRPVFETILTDKPQLGSVFSGGRFDGLTNRFMAGSNVAGVGASVGIDRLIVGMTELGLIEKKETMTEVLVSVFDPRFLTDSYLESLRVAALIRNCGINVEVYLGDEAGMKAQLAYALKKGIPYVVIIGPDEKAAGKVALKDLAQRKQELLTMDELFDKLLK